MSQRTQAEAGGGTHGRFRVRALKPALLGLGAAAVMLAPVMATGPAQASGTTTQQAAAVTWHAFAGTHWSGTDRYFSGGRGVCHYVGSAWNDRVRSARAQKGHRVELWDNSNCSGGAIVIDGAGYGSIGAWVSAYRVIS